MSTSSINGVQNNWISQLSGASGVSRTRSNDGDGDDAAPRARRSGGGRLANAIANALQQIGVGNPSNAQSSGSSADNADPGSTQDPAQAITSFVQTLMAALHAQNSQSTSGQSASGSDSDGDNDGSSSNSAGAAQGHHHRGNLQADLQSLIQQLSASSSSTDSGSSSTSSGSDLQQSFSALMSAIGGSASGSASLGDFLQALSGQLAGSPKQGMIVNERAT